jgi:nicotinate-nucleotide pyrophosphorylase (carboxylating)
VGPALYLIKKEIALEIPRGVVHIIQHALEEDIGPGDITTTLLVPEKSKSRAFYIAKGDFVLAGIPFAQEVFRLLDTSVIFKSRAKEGSRVKKRDIIAEVSGKTHTILSGERVSLNILQRLSGIATLTKTYIDKIKGTKAKIIDTRKTTPGLRVMEKYAVRIGGGSNHRFGLFDGILIKDNHIKASGSIKKAVESAKKGHHLYRIEVEVETVHELKEAIKAGVDIVMLDNMSIKDMIEAVRISNGKVLLEASGGINLGNVREVAECGVDFISVGALTHSVTASDISLKIEN